MATKQPTKIDEQVQLFANIIQSIFSANDFDVALSEKKLALEVQFEELEKRKSALTPAELKLLLTCFPQERRKMEDYADRLLTLMAPRVKLSKALILRALQDSASDYTMKLVEMVAARNPKAVISPEYKQVFLRKGLWHAGVPSLLDPQEAKLLLLTLAIFTRDGQLMNQPYQAVYKALSNSARYASLRDLPFNGFEFTKFMVIARLADEESSTGMTLTPSRNPIYTQFPFSARSEEGESRTVITNQQEQATRGYKLRYFIERVGHHPGTLIPNKSHPFLADLPASYGDTHMVFPEYNQIVIRSTLQGDKPTRPNWMKRFHVDNRSVTILTPEETHQAFHPHVVAVTVGVAPAKAHLLAETVIPTPEQTLILCSPMTTEHERSDSYTSALRVHNGQDVSGLVGVPYEGMAGTFSGVTLFYVKNR